MNFKTTIRLTLFLALIATGAGPVHGRSGALHASSGSPAAEEVDGQPFPAAEPERDLADLSPRWQPAVIDTASDAEYLSPGERLVVREINLLRTDPPEYARQFLLPLRALYHGKLLRYPGEPSLVTEEGAAALEECLEVLAAAKPVPPLAPRQGLWRAARDQVRDQGENNTVGHGGSDHSSPKTRINRYGKWQTAIAENIDYGNAEARRIVTSLLIDDGVANRGHRRNLLDPVYRVVGVAVGPHPSFRHMCVMDFAAGFQELAGAAE